MSKLLAIVQLVALIIYMLLWSEYNYRYALKFGIGD